MIYLDFGVGLKAVEEFIDITFATKCIPFSCQFKKKIHIKKNYR